jgi:hypothetical protein
MMQCNHKKGLNMQLDLDIVTTDRGPRRAVQDFGSAMSANCRTPEVKKEHPMHTTISRSVVAGVAMTILFAATPAAFARVISFSAVLSCNSEVPPNPCSGKGRMNASLDTDTKQLTWTASYSGLTGNVIGAHFHGPVQYVGNTSEQNAPIQVGTPGNLSSPFKGSTTITDTQVKDLLDGRWYFNIHTPKYPAGEIRGHIIR